MGDTGTGSWGSRELGGYLRREQGRKEHAMAKQGLNTNLVGRTICPKPDYGDCTSDHDPNGRIWAGLKPNLMGQWTAEIDAAWIEDGTTKLSVHDPWGNTSEVYMKNVNLHMFANQGT